jgi:hypothetical protein
MRINTAFSVILPSTARLITYYELHEDTQKVAERDEYLALHELPRL